MKKYQFIDPLPWESFGPFALVFIPRTETFITVNAAMIAIMLLLKKQLQQPFSHNELQRFICSHYDISVSESKRQANRLLTQWSAYGILVKS